jgi:hypothetical protein
MREQWDEWVGNHESPKVLECEPDAEAVLRELEADPELHDLVAASRLMATRYRTRHQMSED